MITTSWEQSARRLALAAVLAMMMRAGMPAEQAPTESRNTAASIDPRVISAIRDEALHRSQVMDHASWLTDVFGPRLAGSPAMAQAGEWVMKRFREWGLANVHQEKWLLGKGWSLVRFYAHLVEPQAQPLIGYPVSWTPGTRGRVLADVVNATIDTDADFIRFRGKLRGKIVLPQPVREVQLLDHQLVFRFSDADLAELVKTPVPRAWMARPGTTAIATPTAAVRSAAWRQRLQDFFKTEGVLAVLDRGDDDFIVAAGAAEGLPWQTQRTDGGTIFVARGDDRTPNALQAVPWATIAVEHYNRMMRVLAKGLPVKVELEIDVRFHDESDMNGFNTLAEIPGTDASGEIVMIGAHFDSYHSGTGATDDGAGSAAMMEAMRVLAALTVKPKRTVRIALWGGEEVGLLGSQAYVHEHFGDAVTGARKAGHGKLSAYFNLDNGGGRIRGVWLQNNLAAKPVFQQWIEPLRDLGVTALAPRSTLGTIAGGRLVGGTDHLSFDVVGLPGFQFMQERLEYFSRTSHSNMDVYDRLQSADLVQMSTVAAVFAYSAAMWPEKLPRKTVTDAAR